MLSQHRALHSGTSLSVLVKAALVSTLGVIQLSQREPVSTEGSLQGPGEVTTQILLSRELCTQEIQEIFRERQ